jgi:lipid-binding SYLF domain-containing protein
MALADINNLASDATFGVRVAASLVSTAIAIFNEAPSEVQTLTVTGTPTGGSFTLASLPGSVVSTLTGTLTNAAATVTGLSSTVGLFVGMSVTGTNVPAGATIASITSLTALTHLSQRHRHWGSVA